MSSIFGSSDSSSVCADYFGDELGIPLPPTKLQAVNKERNRLQRPREPENHCEGGTALSMNVNKGTNGGPRPAGGLAFSPCFDGLDCFGTLVFR